MTETSLEDLDRPTMSELAAIAQVKEAFGVLATDWREGINWTEVREWRLKRAREALTCVLATSS